MCRLYLHIVLQPQYQQQNHHDPVSNKSPLRAVKGLKKQATKQTNKHSLMSKRQRCWNTPKPAWTTALHLQDVSQTPDEWLFCTNSDHWYVTSQVLPSSLASTCICGCSAYTEGKGDRNMMKEETNEKHDILFHTENLLVGLQQTCQILIQRAIQNN